MLNVFPNLLAWGLLAPFVLRVALGIVFIQFGLHKLGRGKKEKAAFFDSLGWKPGKYFAFSFGAIELAAGIALILGFYTQIAALIVALISLGALALKKKHAHHLESSAGFLALLFIIALSLLVSGAGLFAFDLPL